MPDAPLVCALLGSTRDSKSLEALCCRSLTLDLSLPTYISSPCPVEEWQACRSVSLTSDDQDQKEPPILCDVAIPTICTSIPVSAEAKTVIVINTGETCPLAAFRLAFAYRSEVEHLVLMDCKGTGLVQFLSIRSTGTTPPHLLSTTMIDDCVQQWLRAVAVREQTDSSALWHSTPKPDAEVIAGSLSVMQLALYHNQLRHNQNHATRHLVFDWRRLASLQAQWAPTKIPPRCVFTLEPPTNYRRTASIATTESHSHLTVSDDSSEPPHSDMSDSFLSLPSDHKQDASSPSAPSPRSDSPSPHVSPSLERVASSSSSSEGASSPAGPRATGASLAAHVPTCGFMLDNPRLDNEGHLWTKCKHPDSTADPPSILPLESRLMDHVPPLHFGLTANSMVSPAPPAPFPPSSSLTLTPSTRPNSAATSNRGITADLKYKVMHAKEYAKEAAQFLLSNAILESPSCPFCERGLDHPAEFAVPAPDSAIHLPLLRFWHAQELESPPRVLEKLVVCHDRYARLREKWQEVVKACELETVHLSTPEPNSWELLPNAREILRNMQVNGRLILSYLVPYPSAPEWLSDARRVLRALCVEHQKTGAVDSQWVERVIGVMMKVAEQEDNK